MFYRYKQVIIRLCCILIIPLVSLIHVSLNIYRAGTHNISTPLDDIIPVLPIFSIPYLYWFVYVFIGLLYLAFRDGKYYFRLLLSIVTGMSICFIIFYFYPTTVQRPDTIGIGLFDRMLGLIYSMDNPYNCFPSIHVLNAMLVTLFLCSYNKGVMFRAWSITSCIAIIISTMFVKQHYILDAVSGIILSTAVYLIFSSQYLWNLVPVQKFTEILYHPRAEDNTDSM